MFDTRLRLSNQVAQEVRRYFGDKVFETIVQRNVRLSEAPSFGKPVILYDATSKGSRNYMSLAREILADNQRYLQHHANGDGQADDDAPLPATGDATEESSASSRSDRPEESVPGALSESSEEKTPANGFSL
jgi:chromosome partitioning protein